MDKCLRIDGAFKIHLIFTYTAQFPHYLQSKGYPLILFGADLCQQHYSSGIYFRKRASIFGNINVPPSCCTFLPFQNLHILHKNMRFFEVSFYPFEKSPFLSQSFTFPQQKITFLHKTPLFSPQVRTAAATPGNAAVSRPCSTHNVRSG